jgi:hypothetical protein
LTHQPCRHASRAASREADDDAHRARRIGLCLGDARCRREDCAASARECAVGRSDSNQPPECYGMRSCPTSSPCRTPGTPARGLY